MITTIKIDRTFIKFKGLCIFGLIITTKNNIENVKISSFIGCSEEEIQKQLSEAKTK